MIHLGVSERMSMQQYPVTSVGSKDLSTTGSSKNYFEPRSSTNAIDMLLSDKLNNYIHDHNYAVLLVEDVKDVPIIESIFSLVPAAGLEPIETGWCRTCASSQNETVLVTGKEGTQKSLLSKLNLFTKIDMEGNTLPMQICRPCIVELERCSAFVDQIQRAEVELNAMLTNYIPAESMQEQKPILNELDGTIKLANSSKMNQNDISKPDDAMNVSNVSAVNDTSNTNVSVKAHENEIIGNESNLTETLTADRNSMVDNKSTVISIKEEPLDITEQPLENDSRNATPIDAGDVKTEQCIVKMDTEEGVSSNGCSTASSIDKDARESNANSSPGQCEPLIFNVSCEYCSEKFFSAEKLKNHQLADHSENMVLSCETCGKSCSDQNVLKEHYSADHGTEMVECTFCNEVYNTEAELRFHMENIHPIIFEERQIPRTYCRICRKYVCTKIFMDHLKTHQLSMEFKCNLCSKSFQSNAMLEHHILLHAGVCPRCDQKFRNPALLERHIARHDASTFVCLDCGEAFYSRETYQAHGLVRECRAAISSRFLTCKICFAAFSKDSALQDHQESHTVSERDYHMKQMMECKHCERIFVTKVYCTIHVMLTHNIRRNDFQCLLCPRLFNDKSNFAKHITHHKKLEDYKRQGNVKSKCEYCGLVLVRAALYSHMKAFHSNLEPSYVCNLCGKQIKRAYNYRTHVRMHNIKKKYKCNLCNTEFLSPSEKIAHARSAHPNYEYHSDKHSPARQTYCSKTLVIPKRLTAGGTVCKCLVCMEEFRSVCAGKAHIIRMHPQTSQAQLCQEATRKHKARVRSCIYKCSFCDQIFNTYDARRTHVIKYHPHTDKAQAYNKALERLKELKKSYKHRCSLCLATFDTHYQRRSHVITNHPKSAKAIEYKLRITN